MRLFGAARLRMSPPSPASATYAITRTVRLNRQ
jgi:hypothetical protein